MSEYVADQPVLAWCRLCNRQALYVVAAPGHRGGQHMTDGGLMLEPDIERGGAWAIRDDGYAVRNRDTVRDGHPTHKCRRAREAAKAASKRLAEATR